MRNFLIDIFYSVLAITAYVVALPILVLLSFKKKYRSSIPARFFGIKNPPFLPNDIWFHVCSLGEAKALKPILDKLESKRVAISTITHTGFTEASKYNADVRYLPYEMWLFFWLERPKVVVVLEAEFWYLLFRLIKSKGAKLILLNSRISDRSYNKYYKMRWFYRAVFRECDKIFVQSEDDRVRFESIGAKNIEVVGNIKLAQEIKATKIYSKPSATIIVAASTHEGEEELILEAFRDFKCDDKKLIVVPRHPERFERVYELIKKYPFDSTRWSESRDFNSTITLVDAMGELNNIYAISDIAILGGAFMPIGGHNPLEPATFGCKIITGENIFLQRELFKYVSNVQIVNNGELSVALKRALTLESSAINGSVELERVINYIKEIA